MENRDFIFFLCILVLSHSLLETTGRFIFSTIGLLFFFFLLITYFSTFLLVMTAKHHNSFGVYSNNES